MKKRQWRFQRVPPPPKNTRSTHGEPNMDRKPPKNMGIKPYAFNIAFPKLKPGIEWHTSHPHEPWVEFPGVHKHILALLYHLLNQRSYTFLQVNM